MHIIVKEIRDGTLREWVWKELRMSWIGRPQEPGWEKVGVCSKGQVIEMGVHEEGGPCRYSVRGNRGPRWQKSHSWGTMFVMDKLVEVGQMQFWPGPKHPLFWVRSELSQWGWGSKERSPDDAPRLRGCERRVAAEYSCFDSPPFYDHPCPGALLVKTMCACEHIISEAVWDKKGLRMVKKWKTLTHIVSVFHQSPPSHLTCEKRVQWGNFGCHQFSFTLKKKNTKHWTLLGFIVLSTLNAYPK